MISRKIKRFLSRKDSLILIIIALGLVAVFLGTKYYQGHYRISDPADPRAQRGLAVTMITLPNRSTIAVEIAVHDKQKQMGMMYRNEVPPGTGMLFLHQEQKYQQIWMKNTYVPLDIVWIGQNKKVLSISENVPPVSPDDTDATPETRTGYAKYVLEIGAGEAQRLGIVKGQLLKFDLP